MKRVLLLAALALVAGGCAHSQVPPTTWQTVVSWTGPMVAGVNECNTAQPCTYIVSRAAATGSTCPAMNASGYAQVATVANNATQATDSSVAAGVSYCYIVQTQQVIPPASQPATSVPSNTALVAVPANPQPPTAPSVTPTPSTTQSGTLVAPPMPAPTPTPTVQDLAADAAFTSAPTRVRVQLVARR